ncbi:MAG: glycosyltransferase [Fibrobacteres bacterium]|nr:glycosyltransferase [Fibrobacterota bacterium]
MDPQTPFPAIAECRRIFIGESANADPERENALRALGWTVVRGIGSSLDPAAFDIILSGNPESFPREWARDAGVGRLLAACADGPSSASGLEPFPILISSDPKRVEALRSSGRAVHWVGASGAGLLDEILVRHWRYLRHRLPAVDWSRISYGHTGIGREGITGGMTEAWKDQAIPLRQRALVQGELRDMYAGRIPRVYRTMADAVRPYAAEGMELLEIGCASGYYSEILEYLLPYRLRYQGADYSEALIGMARDLYPQTPFHVADGAALPFPDGRFPVVVSSCVLLHVPNYLEHIRETIRVSGRLVIAHRTPVSRNRPTQYLRKFAYGVETVELLFNEKEVLAAFAEGGLSLRESIDAGSDPAKDEYCFTYVFEKTPVQATATAAATGGKAVPKVYTISQFTRFKNGKPNSRGGAEKHFHMLAEACAKAGFPCEQLEVADPRLPALLEDPEAIFLVDSWMGALVKRSPRVLSSCISVWAETNLVAYGNPPDDMAMRQLEYWGRPTTTVIAQCVLSKIHLEKWSRHFGYPITPHLHVVPLGVDTDLYHPSGRELPHRLEDALIIHAAPPGNRKKRPDVFERMRGRYRVECLDADIGEEPEKYRRGDIFVHVPYSEDNCYSVIEAMATGMVCVFSDCVNPDKDQQVVFDKGIGYLRGVPFAAYVKSDASQEDIEKAIALAWENRTYLMPRVLAVKYYNLAQWEAGWLDAIRAVLVRTGGKAPENPEAMKEALVAEEEEVGDWEPWQRAERLAAKLGAAETSAPKNRQAKAQLAIAWRNRADMVAAKGGDGVVIEETMAALKAMGHRADLRLEPTPDLSAYDIVHLNNISRSQDTLEHLRHAKSLGKPTVLTSLYEDMDRYLVPAMKTDLLFRYLTTRGKVVPLEALSQLRGSFELDAHPLSDPFARRLGIGDPERQGEILLGVDLILTSGSQESESIRAKFGKTAPIAEMRYGFNRAYREADGRLFAERHGLRDFVLCVGRLEPRKNQWQLIEIFRSLPRQTLVLVGVFSDPSMEPLIKAYAPTNVRFFPRLPLEELASAYAAARLHVLPSWYELPGLVSLEAAAAGSRVASTDWGTSRDYLGEYAWYLPPDDPVAMRRVILEALDSAPKPGLKDHVLNGFGWDKTAQAAVEAYRRVLDR